MPFSNIGQLMNWRTDWFAEAGVKKFPDTWDELYEVGKKLKAKGHPSVSSSATASATTTAGCIRCCGPMAGTRSRPTARPWSIDSAETAQAIDFCRKFFQDTMLEDCLGWTDVSNNKAWMAEQISCTNNAESILWIAKTRFPGHRQGHRPGENPQGPKGRFHLLNSISHSVFNFQPAKEEAQGVSALADDRQALGGWYDSADSYYQPLLHGYDNAPMWNVEPRNIPYRDAMATAHLPGWPAPPARSWRRASPNTSSSTCSPRLLAAAKTPDVDQERRSAAQRTSTRLRTA